MHALNCIHVVCMVVVRKGVGTSSFEPLSYPSSCEDNCCIKAAFNARTKHPNMVSSGSWHKVWADWSPKEILVYAFRGFSQGDRW